MWVDTRALHAWQVLKSKELQANPVNSDRLSPNSSDAIDVLQKLLRSALS